MSGERGGAAPTATPRSPATNSRTSCASSGGGAESPRRVVICHHDRGIEIRTDPRCGPECSVQWCDGCSFVSRRRLGRIGYARQLAKAHGGLPVVDLVKGTPRGGPDRGTDNVVEFPRFARAVVFARNPGPLGLQEWVVYVKNDAVGGAQRRLFDQPVVAKIWADRLAARLDCEVDNQAGYPGGDAA